MLTLSNEMFTLAMREDGTGVTLEDRRRGVCWELDEGTRWVARDVRHSDSGKYTADAIAGDNSPVVPVGKGRAQLIAADEIVSSYATPVGQLRLRWLMHSDGLHVIAEVEDEGVTALSLPGMFRPVDGESFRAAIPSGQGILFTGKGPTFYHPYWGVGHQGGFTLSMFGQLTEHGGLLVIAETDADAVLHWEKTTAGELRLLWRMLPSLQSLSYPREVVIMPTAPDVTALCKSYRRYEITKGRFVNWQEKIARRPKLASLFGSAMVFIGYLQDEDLDYAAAFRGLKAAGIDKAFVYSVRNSSVLDMREVFDFQLIDIREQIPLLHELGYAAGSFDFITDGSAEEGEGNLRMDDAGQPICTFQMNDSRWFSLANARRLALSREHVDIARQAEQDWLHYDVLCCTALEEDYHTEHRTDARADGENRRRMLQVAGEQGMVVSSEGFWGRMTAYYDLGGSKYPAALGGEEYCVVPMTMLVYHDSAIHTWWEADNYNNPQHFSQFNRGHMARHAMYGGRPRIQSTMDALMGTPPDIFPFGKQYNFIPQNHPKLYTYRYRLEDTEVQEAIAFAKPVMALNARIGQLEMVEHHLLSPEGALQESVFADGTRVIANFANIALEVPGGGLLAAESWREIRGLSGNHSLRV